MNETATRAERFIKLPDVMAKVGLGRSSIYAKMKSGDFPKSIELSRSNVVWLESEIDHWILEKVEQRNKKEHTK